MCLNPTERVATPEEVDNGCELGIAYDDCGHCSECESLYAFCFECKAEFRTRADLQRAYHFGVDADQASFCPRCLHDW